MGELARPSPGRAVGTVVMTNLETIVLHDIANNLPLFAILGVDGH
jgi:hypothetical protein